jgi:hypothetical protein
MKISFPNGEENLNIEKVSDIEALWQKISESGFNIENNSLLWNKIEIKKFQSHFDSLLVVHENLLFEKTLVVDKCGTKIRFLEEATVENLIAFILNSGMTSSRKVSSLVFGNRGIDISSERFARLKDVSTNIIWSRTTQIETSTSYPDIIANEAEISRGEIVSSLNIFKERLIQINDSRLLSKATVRKFEVNHKLQLHPITKIKIVLPTRIDIFVEVDSSKYVRDLFTLICQRLKIDRNLLDFTLPPKKLSKSDEAISIVTTDLFPKSTIFIKERS